MKWKIKGIPYYEVGDYGCEHSYTHYRVFRKSKAKKLFEEIRLNLLADARHMFKWTKQEARKVLKQGHREYDTKKEPLDEDTKRYYKKLAKNGDDMYVRMIRNLKEKDPKKIDNYPQETPFMHKEYITW